MKLNIQLFASTNKTTNYNLSQYIGTDKPTYLGDYNSDMNKIDTAIKDVSDANIATDAKASLAQTSATTANTNADNALKKANISETIGNSAIAKIGDLSNLNTTDKNNTVGAINEVNNKLNLKNNYSYQKENATTDNGTIDSVNIKITINDDMSIFKIFGNFNILITDYNKVTNLNIQTDLRPNKKIEFHCGTTVIENNHVAIKLYDLNAIIDTNGTLTFTCWTGMPAGQSIGEVNCIGLVDTIEFK